MRGNENEPPTRAERIFAAVLSLLAIGPLLLLPGRAESGETDSLDRSPMRPAETADAVLNGEEQSWERHLHHALRLPEWIDRRDWRVRFFYTLPVELQDGGVFEDEISTNRRFWGIAWEDLRIDWLRLDAYYLDLDDTVRNQELRTLGVRAYRVAGPARVDYELEGMAQLGERQGRDQRAFAVPPSSATRSSCPGRRA